MATISTTDAYGASLLAEFITVSNNAAKIAIEFVPGTTNLTTYFNQVRRRHR